MVTADAFRHITLHMHAVAKLFIGGCLLETTARALVVEHLVHELIERHLVGIIGVLGQIGLGTAHRHGGVDPELLSHFLDQTHRGIEQFLARRLVGALQQAVGDQPALLARDLAGLVDELHRQGASVHQRKRRDLLRRVRQNGMMPLDVVARCAIFAAPNLVHEGRLALKQQQAEIMLAACIISSSLGGCGSRSDLLLGGIIGQRGHGRRLFLIFEINDEQIARGGVFHAPELLGHELGYLHGKIDEVAIALEICAQLSSEAAIREKLPATVIHAAKRMPGNAHDIGFDVFVRQIQLVFGKHVHA